MGKSVQTMGNLNIFNCQTFYFSKLWLQKTVYVKHSKRIYAGTPLAQVGLQRWESRGLGPPHQISLWGGRSLTPHPPTPHSKYAYRGGGSNMLMEASGLGPQAPNMLVWARDLGPLTPDMLTGLGDLRCPRIWAFQICLRAVLEVGRCSPVRSTGTSIF